MWREPRSTTAPRAAAWAYLARDEAPTELDTDATLREPHSHRSPSSRALPPDLSDRSDPSRPCGGGTFPR